METDTARRNRRLKKILKIILKIAYQILIIMCVLLIAIIVLQKVTSNNKSIGGYRIFRVITGSMSPEYDVGEVVVSKEVDPNTIEVGDDIVYQGLYGEYNGKIIMHKVIGIDKDENGELTFHAKGLHEGSIEDPLIKPSQIYGEVKFKSGILTLLYELATSIYSSFVIITILVLNVFITFRVTEKRRVRTVEQDDDEYEEDYDEEYDDEYDDEYIEDEEFETDGYEEFEEDVEEDGESDN